MKIFTSKEDANGSYLEVKPIKSIVRPDHYVGIFTVRDINGKILQTRLDPRELTKLRHFLRDLEDETEPK